MKHKYLLLKIFLILFPLFFISSCNKVVHKKSQMIFDFEEPGKLNGLVWQCKVDYKLNMLHATQGLYCLEVDFYPSSQPEFKSSAFNDLFHDWRSFKWLCLDIFNPGSNPIRLFYCIDDHSHNFPWIDKANGSILLHHGINHVKINLLRLKSPGSQKKLDLSYIASIGFFLKNSKNKVVLFFDNIHITR